MPSEEQKHCPNQNIQLNAQYIKLIVFSLYTCVTNPNRKYIKLWKMGINVYTGATTHTHTNTLVLFP